MANTISDKLTYLEGTKSAIKDAIVAKGVAVSDSDTFRSYADKIGQISGGGGGKVNLNDYGLTFAYSSMNLANFRALNSQSVTDIITNVSDLTGKDTKTLTFYTNVYNALTEEQKSLAASKNWTLASSK